MAESNKSPNLNQLGELVFDFATPTPNEARSIIASSTNF